MDAPTRPAATPPTQIIEAIDLGLLWLDDERRIAGHNRMFCALHDIDAASMPVGRPLRVLADLLWRRGELFDEEREGFPDRVAELIDHPTRTRFERIRPNGMALSIAVGPLDAGGHLCSFRDVTAERAVREAQRRGTKAAVVAIANLAEHRDVDTAVHVLRVARLVGQTARKLRRHPRFAALIDDDFIEHVATGAILHDVGKIATPDEILLKPGPLTPEERVVMNQHAAVGADLLKQTRLTLGNSPYLDQGIQIALSHHEWYDGGGYPQAIAGDEIPLSGRICAVVDVFDALTGRRPYKQPWTTEKTLELIRAQAGKQFDPDVVDAFLAVIAERETVRLVRWTDDFSVGNLHIDEQHGILLDTINQLASAESLRDRHRVLMIIDELVGYASFHFDYEERLMARGGYPDLEQHRITHQAFVKWVGDLRDEYLGHGKRALGESVLRYLRDWLSHHILGEDQRYRGHIPGSPAQADIGGRLA